MPEFEPRPATLADVGEIASVLVDTWRTTFRGRLPDAFLAGMSVAQQEERYCARLARTDCTCFVASDEKGHLFGFGSGGPARSPLLKSSGELYALYVRQERQGLGIGRALFQAVAATLSECGGSLGVWVLQVNPAFSFYEHLGGKKIASEEITLGGTSFAEVGFAWSACCGCGARQGGWYRTQTRQAR